MSSLIISAIGPDRPGIVSELTGIITNHGGNIEDSRMSRLGSDFGIIMLVSVDPKWQEALVVSIKALKELAISTRGTNMSASTAIKQGENWKISLKGADNEGIVNVLSKYFAKKDINILDMETHISNAPVTGTPLFNLITVISKPEDLDVDGIQSDLNQIAHKLGVEIEVCFSESGVAL